MRINTESHKQNFKGIYQVQIPKKAFREPNDYYGVASAFCEKVSEITGEKRPVLQSILSLMGLGRRITKTYLTMEQPYFQELMSTLQDVGNYSLSWVSLRTKLPVRPPLSENHHSFFVYTKEQKDKVLKFCSFRKILGVSTQLNKEMDNPDPIRQDPLWRLVRRSNLFNEKFDEVAEGVSIQKFEIEDLSELPKVFKQIDY